MFFEPKVIAEEYERLDVLCNVSTKYMPIRTYEKASKTVAMCRFVQRTAIPSQFLFNLYYLRWMSETDCLDVIRHEYAHAASALIFGGAALSGTGHGALWKEVCRIVGCRPYPYTYSPNIMELLPEQRLTGAEARCYVQCCRCGAITEHAENSRIIKVLKAGLDSWNYICPSCGGLRFRLSTPNG